MLRANIARCEDNTRNGGRETHTEIAIASVYFAIAGAQDRDFTRACRTSCQEQDSEIMRTSYISFVLSFLGGDGERRDGWVGTPMRFDEAIERRDISS